MLISSYCCEKALRNLRVVRALLIVGNRKACCRSTMCAPTAGCASTLWTPTISAMLRAHSSTAQRHAARSRLSGADEFHRSSYACEQSVHHCSTPLLQRPLAGEVLARERGHWDGGARVASEAEPPAGATTGRNNKRIGVLTLGGSKNPPMRAGRGLLSAVGQQSQVWPQAHSHMWRGGSGQEASAFIFRTTGTAEAGEVEPPGQGKARAPRSKGSVTPEATWTLGDWRSVGRGGGGRR